MSSIAMRGSMEAPQGEPEDEDGDAAPGRHQDAAAPETSAVDLAVQERELDSVLGKLPDDANGIIIVRGGTNDTQLPIPRAVIRDGKIDYMGNSIVVASLDKALEEERSTFLRVNDRVAAAAKELTEIESVLAPFNGGETTGLLSAHTLALDQLPIGTPKQVEELARNTYARGLYLIDKLTRGHSYTGMTHALGYTGAMLQWDIEHIQGGSIQDVAYLDGNGNVINDPDAPAAGIRLTYSTPDNRTRIHEQYSSPTAINTRPSLLG